MKICNAPARRTAGPVLRHVLRVIGLIAMHPCRLQKSAMASTTTAMEISMKTSTARPIRIVRQARKSAMIKTMTAMARSMKAGFATSPISPIRQHRIRKQNASHRMAVMISRQWMFTPMRIADAASNAHRHRTTEGHGCSAFWA